MLPLINDWCFTCLIVIIFIVCVWVLVLYVCKYVTNAQESQKRALDPRNCNYIQLWVYVSAWNWTQVITTVAYALTHWVVAPGAISKSNVVEVIYYYQGRQDMSASIRQEEQLSMLPINTLALTFIS